MSMSLIEWETKTLATFIAATVQTEKGKKNPLLEQAAKLMLPYEGRPEAQEVDVEEIPEGVDEIDWIFEHGSRTAASKNSTISFEQLSQGFGGRLPGHAVGGPP